MDYIALQVQGERIKDLQEDHSSRRGMGGTGAWLTLLSAAWVFISSVTGILFFQLVGPSVCMFVCLLFLYCNGPDVTFSYT